MKNKKLLAALALTGAMLLVGCNDIYSRPTSEVKEQALISNSNVDHNTVEWLYDTLHDTSNTAEDVRDVVFNVLSEGLFGKYSINTDGDVVIEGYDGKSDSEKLEFVKAHKAYWSQGKQEGSTKFDYVEPTSLTDEIKARIDFFKYTVRKQAALNLYSAANTDSYKVRGYFYEVKYARSLAKKLYKINGVSNVFDPKYDNDDETFSYKFLIDSSVNTENFESIIGIENNHLTPMLHMNLYSEYLNNEILPDIMKNLLVEQYVYDNVYTAISRAQYRKLNFIAISTENRNVFSARSLMDTFVEQYIDTARAEDPIDFEILADAWKGVFDDLMLDGGYSLAGNLLIDAGFTFGTPTIGGEEIETFADGCLVTEHPYFENTKYGDLIEEFAKITLNPNTTNSDTESTFTSSGSYSIETGLEIKTNDVRSADFTTLNWGNKESGFTTLPSDVKTRLFDYTVMTDFNNPANIDKNSYLKEVNGHYFLKSSISQGTSTADSIVIKDGSSLYIVEVLEAPSQSSLTIGGENAYENSAASGLRQETLARTIGYNIASGSTYRTTAFTHYLEDCEITYHDQSVYNYFLSTYPDLFD